MKIVKSVKINIAGEDFEIGFPNIGQYMKIETEKQRLSSGRYSLLALSNNRSSVKALDMIDCFAVLTTMIPGLAKKLGIEDGNILELDIEKAESVMEQFYTIYAPFYNGFVTDRDKIMIQDHYMEIINKLKEEQKDVDAQQTEEEG